MPQTTLNIPRETTHQRIADALEDIVDKLVDTSDADNINYDNTTSGLSASKVQGAIDELSSEKVDKISGKGLSTNDYTTAEKTKLAGIEEYANKTVVDSAMSGTSTNPLQNKVITKELERPKTVQGSLITINDAAPVNAVDLKVDIEPVQDLHGYDKPWVGGAWKNKLPLTVEEIKSINTSGTWNGNVYSRNNGTIEILVDTDNNIIGFKVNGTFTAQTSLYLNTNLTSTILGDSIILNGCPIGGDISKFFLLLQLFGSPYSWISTDVGNGDRGTLSSGVRYQCLLRVMEGQTLTNAIFYPMIRLATETDSTFAPYTNICSISGRSEVAIDRVGKNYVYIENGTLENDATKSVQLRRCRTGNMCYIKANTDYVISASTLSGKIINISYQIWESNSFGSNTKLYDSGWQNVPIIINLSNNRWITFVVKYSDESNISFEDLNIQLELGSTATAYEPYQGNTYTIQLGDTIYGGELDVTEGELEVTKGIVEIDNTWGLGTYGGKNYLTKTISDIYINYNNRKNPISNMCEFGGYGGAAIFKDGKIYQSDNSLGDLYLQDSRYTVKADFVSAYEGCVIVYELATPYTIQLTPQQIKLLKGTNTVYSDSGQVYIEYQPYNAIGEAVRIVENENDTELEYKTDLSNIAPIENNDTASTSYTIGSYLCHNGKLYKVISAIASGETFTSSNIQQTTIMAEIMSRL